MTAASSLLTLATTPLPIPDLPPRPVPYSHHPVTIVALIVVGIAMIAFTVVILSYILGRGTPRPMPWRPIRWSLVPAFGALAVAGVLITTGEHRATAAGQEYGEVEAAAAEQVRGELEAAYGVQWQRYSYIPMQDGEWGGVELRLPDGTTQECYVVAEGGEYSIRCGGDTPEESEPLEPVNP